MKLREQINEFLIAFSDNDFFDKHPDDFLDISFVLDWSEETQIAFMAAKIIYNESKPQIKRDKQVSQPTNTTTQQNALDKYKFRDTQSIDYVYSGMTNPPSCLKYPHSPHPISKKVIPFQDIL
jgi:hypothetical protein